MATMTISLPDAVATLLAAEHISQEQLEAFVGTAVQAWLRHRQVNKGTAHGVEGRPWSEAFQGNADAFIDQLIDENRALFEALARL